MSRTPLPACPRKRAPLWYTFFALPAVNDPLPPELKFRENTANQPLPSYMYFVLQRQW